MLDKVCFGRLSLAKLAICLAAATCIIGAARSVVAPQADVLEPPTTYCVTSPSEAYASTEERPGAEFAVRLPGEGTPAGLEATRVESVVQGTVVRIKVTSQRAGGVAVHGVMDVKPVTVGAESVVAFRTIYTGRFPLHFHGADGSHFELVALEILPATVPVKRLAMN